eukprot:3932348-Prymnesium_polylepis.1
MGDKRIGPRVPHQVPIAEKARAVHIGRPSNSESGVSPVNSCDIVAPNVFAEELLSQCRPAICVAFGVERRRLVRPEADEW